MPAKVMASAKECISERECKKYDEGLNNKVKIVLFRSKKGSIFME